MMINREFGKRPPGSLPRRAPAHAPYIFDSEILEDFYQRYPEECEYSAATKVRMIDNFPLPFTYYNYLGDFRLKYGYPDYEMYSYY